MRTIKLLLGLKNWATQTSEPHEEWQPHKQRQGTSISQRAVSKSNRLRIEYNVDGQKQIL